MNNIFCIRISTLDKVLLIQLQKKEPFGTSTEFQVPRQIWMVTIPKLLIHERPGANLCPNRSVGDSVKIGMNILM